jgi:hypothetical protein
MCILNILWNHFRFFLLVHVSMIRLLTLDFTIFMILLVISHTSAANLVECLWYLMPISINNISVICQEFPFIGGGNRSMLRKPLT